MSSRTLVITADDYGRDPATTQEILGLAADGAVTATSLIAVSEHAADAARAAVQAGLAPKLHLTLSRERELGPWRPLSGGHSLRDFDSLLPVDPTEVGRSARGDEVVAEADAQLAWMRGHGLVPGAVDSHAGTVYGLHGTSFLGDMLPWCAENELAFRLPRSPILPSGAPLPEHLRDLHGAALAAADTLGVTLPAAIISNTLTATQLGDYGALRARMISLVSTLPAGASELFLHPAAPASSTPQERVWEARLLRDPVWRRALQDQDIDVVEDWWT